MNNCQYALKTFNISLLDLLKGDFLQCFSETEVIPVVTFLCKRDGK